MAEVGSGLTETAAVAEDHGDGLAHLLETFQGNWRASESYVHGRLALRFDYWVRAGDRDGRVKHHIVVFQRTPGVDRDLPHWTQDILVADQIDFEKLRIAVDGTDGGDERPVFVLIGKPPKPGEGMGRWVAVQSVVWLAELDESEGGLADPPDVSLPSFSLTIARVVRRLLIKQGKCVAEGRPLAIGNYELAHQVIQDAPQVVDVVADNDAPLQWRLASNFDAAEKARGLLVYLADDPVGIGFAFEKEADVGFERLKVQFCAL